MGPSVILTVTLNAALDVTYRIDGRLTAHDTHRVRSVASAPGGKGLNVARVLHALGTPVLACGLLGGRTGAEIAERMPAGLRHSFTTVAEESRRALVIHDADDATGLWEPGPDVAAAEWHAFYRRYTGLLQVATVAVLAGSLPRGLPDDAYAKLVAAAREAGVSVIVDCDGPALHAALTARPDVVKPNLAELAAAVPDADVTTTAGVQKAASQLRTAGAGAVVASRGPLGLLAVDAHGACRAVLPETLSGNPTGAGDACVAGLARGLYYRFPRATSLAEAAAAGAAAVKQPVAGEIGVDDFLRYRRITDVEEL